MIMINWSIVLFFVKIHINVDGLFSIISLYHGIIGVTYCSALLK